MKAREYPPFIQPERQDVTVPCTACKAFRAEVDTSPPLCRICAHHVIDHGVPPDARAMNARCECLPTEIYPRAHFGTSAEFEARRDAVIERRASPVRAPRRAAGAAPRSAAESDPPDRATRG